MYVCMYVYTLYVCTYCIYICTLTRPRRAVAEGIGFGDFNETVRGVFKSWLQSVALASHAHRLLASPGARPCELTSRVFVRSMRVEVAEAGTTET